MQAATTMAWQMWLRIDELLTLMRNNIVGREDAPEGSTSGIRTFLIDIRVRKTDFGRECMEA